MPATAEIKGADKLLRKLQRIPVEMHAGIRDALAEQAAEVVALMKRLVPVDQATCGTRSAGPWAAGAEGRPVAREGGGAGRR